jgi:hypothetical protein
VRPARWLYLFDGGHTRTVRNAKSRDLMVEIRRDLLAEKPLATVLRKLILLGGDAGSTELRSWAVAELRGYSIDDDLPAYRTVTAPLQIDGVVPGATIRHQTISSFDLPDFARDDLSESVPLRMSVREIQSLVGQHASSWTAKLQPPGASLVVRFMNDSDRINGRVTALYWAVSTIALEGVLDQVRTRLAELIAELRSTTAAGQNVPTAEQADNAVNLIINGHRNRVTVTQRAQGPTITSTSEGSVQRFWTRARLVGAAVVGFATLVGTVVAVIQFWR